MPIIGLLREEKIPHDNRVAFTPLQCKWIQEQYKNIKIIVQSSSIRCYRDEEYRQLGISVVEQLNECDILLGIKEVPIDKLISHKTYYIFSHTKKAQPHNRKMFQTMMDKNITLVDYECLTHDDEQRILGFGFFAGVVGAHNGMMAYGERTRLYHLKRIKGLSLNALINLYFGLKLPPIKIAITGSGRVSKGIIEIMNLMDIQEVEPDEYINKTFKYPVYVHLKNADLYQHKINNNYIREDFHTHPQQYNCLFKEYIPYTDILMNGIYWDENIPRLFEMDELRKSNFHIQTIADITDDINGSIPCNIGDSTIDEPVYGIDKLTHQKTLPYLPNSVDIMAVGNLPNEMPRDASRYFGEQLIKYILEDMFRKNSNSIERATILNKGKLTPTFNYLSNYTKK